LNARRLHALDWLLNQWMKSTISRSQGQSTGLAFVDWYELQLTGCGYRLAAAKKMRSGISGRFSSAAETGVKSRPLEL
jgi:hypothetical protein